MKDFKEARELMRDYDFDIETVREMFDNSDHDMEDGNYRIIDSDSIDEIMQEELKSDLYILGCFNANFLANILGISTKAIEMFQKSEAYKGIGELIISGGHLEELQEDYVSADGYGHHFAHYDGNEYEIEINGNNYYIFKTN